MSSGSARGSAGLVAREAHLTATLAGLEEQRWAASEAFFARSEVRSSLGDHVGALEDARFALNQFPTHTKYLLRACQVTYESGLPYDAGQLLQRAKESISPAHGDEATLAALDTLAALERRLRPFDILPDELLTIIFEHVQQDWERLPSPFQLPHVCSRWKRLAESTASLWRDLRILRISDKAHTTTFRYHPPLKEVYGFFHLTASGQELSRRDLNHFSLMRCCKERSGSTLTCFELNVWEWQHGSEWLTDLVYMAYYSHETLEMVTFIQSNRQERQRFADPRDIAVASPFAAASLDATLYCSQVRDIELSVGELLQGEDDISEFRGPLPDEPATSFRRLRLDCFGGFSDPRRAPARDQFLLRSSKLQSLSLHDLPDIDMVVVEPDNLPFVLRLLVACAETLVELEVEGQANLLAGAQAAAITSFSKLRRYKHVRRRSWLGNVPRIRARDMNGLAFPKLETLEATTDVITKFPQAPLLRVILRLGNATHMESDCKRFAAWLVSLEEGRSPYSLTLLDTHDHVWQEYVHPIIDALTPSRTGVLACPKLRELRLVRRPAHASNDADYCPSLGLAPMPPDREHQEAGSVPRLARLAVERERISQGLPPVEGGPDDGTEYKRCAPLTIELEGWVFREEDEQ